MTNDNEKKEWRELWLNSINELTTLELQEKSWLRKIIITESPHWSFIEFRSCYFDDLLYYDYSHFIKTEWITQTEYNIIQDWHKELKKYESPKKNDYNHKAILRDENWRKIIRKGEKVRENLKKIILENEKELLKGMKAYSNFKELSFLNRKINKIKDRFGN
jgi:hypothetical protein